MPPTYTLTVAKFVSSQDTEREVSSFLSKKLSGRLAGIDMVEKENLDLVSRYSRKQVVPGSSSGTSMLYVAECRGLECMVSRYCRSQQVVPGSTSVPYVAECRGLECMVSWYSRHQQVDPESSSGTISAI